MGSQDFSGLFSKAVAAGQQAALAKVPQPMVVVQRFNPLDDSSPVVKQYEPVMDGVCGFAWVNVKPGNSPFANWLKKNGKARSSYSGGVDIWISDYNQSMEKKEAHAYAMAKVFQEAGIKAYGESRMD